MIYTEKELDTICDPSLRFRLRQLVQSIEPHLTVLERAILTDRAGRDEELPEALLLAHRLHARYEVGVPDTELYEADARELKALERLRDDLQRPRRWITCSGSKPRCRETRNRRVGREHSCPACGCTSWTEQPGGAKIVKDYKTWRAAQKGAA
jgi:hypothetical protein